MAVHGHHGSVRGRASALLGGVEHAHHPAAEMALQQASSDERSGGEVSFDEDQLEAARKIFGGPIAFLMSAPDLKFLPDTAVPEIELAGRSQVVKSSHLNALATDRAWYRNKVETELMKQGGED